MYQIHAPKDRGVRQNMMPWYGGKLGPIKSLAPSAQEHWNSRISTLAQDQPDLEEVHSLFILSRMADSKIQYVTHPRALMTSARAVEANTMAEIF